MMDALDTIMTRRSIRRFEATPVSDDMVETLLRAAMAAPSAGNEQAWRFIVVRERETLRAIAACSPYAGLLENAPLGIVVAGDITAQKHEGYWVQDCAAATENLLLAAHAIGLGAVWLGYHPVPERCTGTATALDLPEHIVTFSVIALGYPTEAKPPGDRYDPEKVRFERWS